MYKKILAGLLAVALVCGSAGGLPTADIINETTFIRASAEDIDDFDFRYYGSNVFVGDTLYLGDVYLVESYKGNSQTIYLPETYNNGKVAGVTHGAVSVNTTAEIINIPSSYSYIETDFFEKFKNLKSIEVDKNNEKYSSENGVLFNKEKTEIIYIPNSAKEVTLPTTVSPGDYINLSGEKECECVSFEGGKNLENIYVSQSNPYFLSLNGILYSKDKKIVYYIPPQRKQVIIYDGVEIISPYSMPDNNIFEKIQMPDSVEKVYSIGGDNLKDVSMPENAFIFCNIGTIKNIDWVKREENNSVIFSTYGVNLLGAYIEDFSGNYVSKIEIPKGIKNIGSFALAASNEEFIQLEEIIIPDGVKIIQDGAFAYTKLKSVNLPITVTEIGSRAFINCPFESVAIPKSVETIGSRAFGYSTDNKGVYKDCDFHIYCYPNTAGEKYAKDNEFDYTLIGDLSGDGKLSTADVGRINAAVRSTKPITDETQKMLADVNGDGKITTADVGKLNAYVRGTLTKW